MIAEKTPEEKARSKRAHADAMIAVGVVTTLCALAGSWIAWSGRADAPDWLFGGARAARASRGSWSNDESAVRFEAWGRAPFARAKREGKLVLLFLGPSYSAPTARMLSETFANADVAAFVQSRFVPVRVKAEESPDLDRRYRAGGWPTTSLLLPDGVVLAAGTSMSARTFLRWAGPLAERAATHPDAVARAESEAAAARERAAAALAPAGPPASARDALVQARAALTRAWAADKRTFDAGGPRFPRFERIAALRRLEDSWARDMAAESGKGALIFQDPGDGGFRRAANPDGTPAALEKIASDQAAALEALCGARPAATKRLLDFLGSEFSLPDSSWAGWLSGYALSPDARKASDGESYETFRASGGRAAGPARTADAAALARAVLDCGQSSPALRSRALKTLSRQSALFAAAARARDPRLLLDDVAALGPALLAAGRTSEAARVWAWMEESLSGGAAFYDRVATGVLPPEIDRLPDPALNARALRFAQELRAALPDGPARDSVMRREANLFRWLSAHSQSLDPAVWAALAAKEPQ